VLAIRSCQEAPVFKPGTRRSTIDVIRVSGKEHRYRFDYIPGKAGDIVAGELVDEGSSDNCRRTPRVRVAQRGKEKVGSSSQSLLAAASLAGRRHTFDD
jgi:hypothetical protein